MTTHCDGNRKLWTLQHAILRAERTLTTPFFWLDLGLSGMEDMVGLIIFKRRRARDSFARQGREVAPSFPFVLAIYTQHIYIYTFINSGVHDLSRNVSHFIFCLVGSLFCRFWPDLS